MPDTASYPVTQMPGAISECPDIRRRRPRMDSRDVNPP